MLNARRAWLYAHIAVAAKRVNVWAHARARHHLRICADAYYRDMRPSLVARGNDELRKQGDAVFGDVR